MARVIGVKFKESGKSYYFDPRDTELKQGDEVIVETARGMEYGVVAHGVKEIPDDEVIQPLREVVRAATDTDREQLKKNKEKEREAFLICEEKIAAHKLEMKLVDVEYTFDSNKILFYFTADGRIDFRELVKDLASVFRTRIELRQIGIRDEAKMLGGIGICGRGLCCSTFLEGFHPVSIKMAKEQGLSLNPTKISGNCGRLMCCLKYEQNCYDELAKITPSAGAIVMTPDGKGVVHSVLMLKGIITVRLDNETDGELSQYNLKDIKILKNGRNRENRGDKVDMKALKKLEES